MQVKQKIAILSGILAITALTTTSIAPSALAQRTQGKRAYGFIYRHASSGLWQYRWGYKSRSECDNLGRAPIALSDAFQQPGQYRPATYDIVYDCQVGTQIEFQYDVAEFNRRSRY